MDEDLQNYLKQRLKELENVYEEAKQQIKNEVLLVQSGQKCIGELQAIKSTTCGKMTAIHNRTVSCYSNTLLVNTRSPNSGKVPFKRKRKFFPPFPSFLFQELNSNPPCDFHMPSFILCSQLVKCALQNTTHQKDFQTVKYNTIECNQFLPFSENCGKETLETNTSDQNTSNTVDLGKEVLCILLFDFLGLTMVLAGKNSITIYTQKLGSWAKVSETNIETPIDDILYLQDKSTVTDVIHFLCVNKSIPSLILFTCNSDYATSLKTCDMKIASFVLVASLHSLEFIVSGDKIIKYVWEDKKNCCRQLVEMMPVDRVILALSRIEQQPNALLGHSTFGIALWNHTNGILLQYVALESALIGTKILDCHSYSGLVFCHMIARINGNLMCVNIVCNFYANKCAVMRKELCSDISPQLRCFKQNKIVCHGFQGIKKKIKHRFSNSIFGIFTHFDLPDLFHESCSFVPKMF